MKSRHNKPRKLQAISPTQAKQLGQPGRVEKPASRRWYDTTVALESQGCGKPVAPALNRLARITVPTWAQTVKARVNA